MDDIFNGCVMLLLWLSQVLDLTYEQVNVIIVCIIWPAVTLVLAVVIVVQHTRLQGARTRLDLWKSMMGYIKPRRDNDAKEKGRCGCGGNCGKTQDIGKDRD